MQGSAWADCVACGGKVPFIGRHKRWAKKEYNGVFAFADGSRLEGRFRGLCPIRGVLTDASGRRWCVAYKGDAWLALDLEAIKKEEVLSLP